MESTSAFRSSWSSELRVWASTSSSTFTDTLEVAAVQQMSVCGTDVTVERCILVQTRESNRGLIKQQLQPRPALTVVQDKQQVGAVRHNETAAETPS